MNTSTSSVQLQRTINFKLNTSALEKQNFKIKKLITEVSEGDGHQFKVLPELKNSSKFQKEEKRRINIENIKMINAIVNIRKQSNKSPFKNESYENLKKYDKKSKRKLSKFEKTTNRAIALENNRMMSKIIKIHGGSSLKKLSTTQKIKLDHKPDNKTQQQQKHIHSKKTRTDWISDMTEPSVEMNKMRKTNQIKRPKQNLSNIVKFIFHEKHRIIIVDQQDVNNGRRMQGGKAG